MDGTSAARHSSHPPELLTYEMGQNGSLVANGEHFYRNCAYGLLVSILDGGRLELRGITRVAIRRVICRGLYPVHHALYDANAISDQPVAFVVRPPCEIRSHDN